MSLFTRLLSLFVFAFFVAISCKHTNEYKNRVTTIKNIPESELMLMPTFNLQGHRGARGLYPENSIIACKEAIDIGVNTLELNLVISKDSQIVVSHESFMNAIICLGAQGDTLKEEDGKKIKLYDLTVAEIQRHDCGSLGNIAFPEQKKQKTYKPTLQELVQTIEKYAEKRNKSFPLFYNLEIKSSPETDSTHHPKPDVFADFVYQEIKKLHIMERTTIQSFDIRALQEIHKLNEEISLSLLVDNKSPLKENIKRLGFLPTIYSPHFERLTEAEVKQAHEMGMKVIPWTVNEKKDMLRLQKMLVDGIITDYPNRFQK